MLSSAKIYLKILLGALMTIIAAAILAFLYKYLLRHHRTIVSAAFAQSFAPSVQL